MKREVSQRHLALELRYQIDSYRNLADDVPTMIRRNARRRVSRLIRDNPRGVRSSHVRHNLGEGRLAWLAEAGLVR